MRKDLCIVQTEYSLLLYLLLNKNWKKSSYFLLYSRISDKTIREMHRFGCRFVGSYLFLTCGIWLNERGKFAESSFKSLLKTSFFFAIKMFRNVLIKAFVKIIVLLKSYFGDKNLWHVYASEHNWVSQLLMEYGWFFDAIEDGNTSYLNYDEATRYWGKFFSHLKHTPGGWSKAVNTIYMTGIREIPKGIKHKVTIIDLPALWGRYTVDEQNDICRVFHFEYEKMYTLVQKGYCNVLLAENFAPDFISIKEQIDIYAKILSNYDKGTVIIKRHPASIIDYKEYFPECYVLEDDFPFEFFWLTNIPIQRVITMHSTAALFRGSEIKADCYEEYYKEYILPKIEEAKNANEFFVRAIEKVKHLRK